MSTYWIFAAGPPPQIRPWRDPRSCVPAGAKIKDTAYFRVIQQPQDHIDAVTDIDEITLLATVLHVLPM